MRPTPAEPGVRGVRRTGSRRPWGGLQERARAGRVLLRVPRRAIPTLTGSFADEQIV